MAVSASASLLAAAVLVSAGTGYIAGQLAAPTAPSGDGGANLEREAVVDQRLDDLQTLLEDVDRRLRSAQLQPLAATPEPAPLAQAAPVIDPEVLAAVERVAAALDSGEAFSGDALLVEQVGNVVEQLREQEREERDQARAEERARFLEERLTEMQGELGLDSYQVTSMRTLFTDMGEKRNEAMDLFRSGSWEEGREALDTIRSDTDTRLAEILSPSQLEGYEEMGGLMVGGWGRRGGPGGDGPGGGRRR